MRQTTFYERVAAVSRRLGWVVLIISIVVVCGTLWIGAFRTPPPASFMERYGDIGMGLALAGYAAITLLPPKHQARWVLWSLCAAATLLAIADFWLKVTS